MKHASPSQQRRGLYIHALEFVLTIVVLVGVNVWTGSPYWVLWILPGWTVSSGALVVHAGARR